MGTTAVALRYAEALYELASEQSRTDVVLADLAALKASFEADRENYARLLHPRLERAEKDKILVDRFLGGRDPLVANTMRLLVKRHRENLLPHFFLSYLSVHEERSGVVRVEVETAAPMDDAARSALSSRVSQALKGASVELETREDPALLGGMRLMIGSRLYDGSVRRRLERIEKGLKQVPLQSN